MKKQGLFTLLLLFISVISGFGQNTKTNIEYSLSMPEPHTHYYEVSMTIENISSLKEITNKNEIDFKMPVWTPGSYLVREFAKNVEGFRATDGKNILNAKKINKNTWRVQTNGSNKVQIAYKVYAFEMSVRTSFLDDTHGYLNGASVFMYVPQLKMSPSKITINPCKNWNSISTGLKKISEKDYTYYSPDYDILVDSPIEIGTHKVLSFTSMGVPHKIAMYSNGPLSYDEAKVIETYKKVVEASASVVNDKHPCEDYTFIVHHLPNIGGGLEHLNSTTCQTSPNAYMTDGAFKGFMSLIAHEYFHLWNVKRIRPIALGPFDYDNENYTTMLWVSEGFTSFYQDYILRRAGVLTPEEYQGKFLSEIGTIENQPGQKVQSIAESSWDAWIKYYRPNENSRNSTISYYDKGGVVGGILNLYILGETKGKKNLDDVMRLLWNEYYKKQGRGFKDEEFKDACEKVIGKKLDAFFKSYIEGTDAINYNEFFKYVGLKLVEEKASAGSAWIGANIVNGKIGSVLRDSPAYQAGLNVNDEIVEIDGMKTSTPANYLLSKKEGDVIKVTVKRYGQNFSYDITVAENPSKRYKLEKLSDVTKEQEELYKKWMFVE